MSDTSETKNILGRKPHPDRDARLQKKAESNESIELGIKQLLNGGSIEELDAKQLQGIRNRIVRTRKKDPLLEALPVEMKENLIRESMRAIGKGSSEAKRASLAKNALLPRPGRKSRPLSDFPCTCGKCPPDGEMPTQDFKVDRHCNRGVTIFFRRYRNRPMNP